jgi:hypothetical protein
MINNIRSLWMVGSGNCPLNTWMSRTLLSTFWGQKENHAIINCKWLRKPKIEYKVVSRAQKYGWKLLVSVEQQHCYLKKVSTPMRPKGSQEAIKVWYLGQDGETEVIVASLTGTLSQDWLAGGLHITSSIFYFMPSLQWWMACHVQQDDASWH